jgi:hypothetical protein
MTVVCVDCNPARAPFSRVPEKDLLQYNFEFAQAHNVPLRGLRLPSLGRGPIKKASIVTFCQKEETMSGFIF